MRAVGSLNRRPITRRRRATLILRDMTRNPPKKPNEARAIGAHVTGREAASRVLACRSCSVLHGDKGYTTDRLRDASRPTAPCPTSHRRRTAFGRTASGPSSIAPAMPSSASSAASRTSDGSPHAMTGSRPTSWPPSASPRPSATGYEPAPSPRPALSSSPRATPGPITWPAHPNDRHGGGQIPDPFAIVHPVFPLVVHETRSFRSRTPAPPPFSGMNSTPAASRVRWMATSFLIKGAERPISNRRTILSPRPAA